MGAAAVAWLLARAGSDGMLGPGEIGALSGGTFVVVSLAAMMLSVMGRRRRALEAVLWLARQSSHQYRAATGDGVVPTTPAKAAAWLDRHPRAPSAMRVFCHLVVGNIPAAHEEADRLPGATDQELFERLAIVQLIALAEGRAVDLHSLHAAASALDGDAHFHALGDIANLEAMVAAAEGRDWHPPMLNIRGELGDRAEGVLLGTVWLWALGVLVGTGVITGLAGAIVAVMYA